MMTLQELLTPSHKPEVLRKISDSLDEFAKEHTPENEPEFIHAMLLAAASGVIEAFAKHLEQEKAE